jgi:DNA polymerase
MKGTYYMDIKNTLKEKIITITTNYTKDRIRGYITGDGPIPCDIIFVGEATGKTEVEHGKPFVGAAGKTLEKYLNSINLYRDNIRMTNACFFRPIEVKESTTGRITIRNRTPKTIEIELFREVLDEEIKYVNPKVIITLGNVPLKRFTKFRSIGQCHGNLYFNGSLQRYLFPMYHPSALTYNRNKQFLSLYESDWNKLKVALKSL